MLYKKISRTDIDTNLATELARSYNILAPISSLRSLLKSAFKDEDFSSFSKFELHLCMNEIWCDKYYGESKIKSLLVNYFIQEDVAAFEINANNSRLDFLAINGDTNSYEIKSELDSLKKLPKQVHDYESLFEYNYVVLDKKHLTEARKLISSHYGIFIIDGDNLQRKRKAKRNQAIHSSSQLNLFTKKELYDFFGRTEKGIIAKYTKKQINEIFKEMLKKRYSKRWMFLKEHKKDILPIDYQYFFHHNIPPSVIYGLGQR